MPGTSQEGIRRSCEKQQGWHGFWKRKYTVWEGEIFRSKGWRRI